MIEKEILSQVDHPFILKLKNFFESDLRYYFFCDFMPGRDLKFQMDRRGKAFTLSEVRFIGAQVLLALEHLHKKGYIHRDVKPENVLMDAEGYVKLADFGIVNKRDEGNSNHKGGSVMFMAPEVCENAFQNEDNEL